ncbi:hypothetical protein F4677DRAFT_300254 [Hypoxylon crocopeplum]|nr:hypothetical protein F4677DRAFT_300254 [Hypoxylon crocopeplum]
MSDAQPALHWDRPNSHHYDLRSVHVEIRDSSFTGTYSEKMTATTQVLAPQGDRTKQVQPSQSNLRDIESTQAGEGVISENARGAILSEPTYSIRTPDKAQDITTALGLSNPIPTGDPVNRKFDIPEYLDVNREAPPTAYRTSEVATRLQSDGPDPFRDPMPVPHVSPLVLVYPHSTSKITSAYHDRYAEIVNIFRQNTLEDPRLSSHAKHIDYGLKLCGHSRETVHPSILVFCRPREFKTLKNLFDQEHLKAQYLQRTTQRSIWHSLRNRKEEQTPSRPLFKLYFWRAQRPRTLLWGDRVDVRIGSESATASPAPFYMYDHSLTLCGSPIYRLPGGRRVSTVACVLHIGSDFYGLTASHGIRRHDRHLHATIAKAQKEAAAELTKPTPRQYVEDQHVEGALHRFKSERSCKSLASEYHEPLVFDDDDDDDVVYESLTDEEDYESDNDHDDNGNHDTTFAAARIGKGEPEDGYMKVETMRRVFSTATAVYPQLDTLSAEHGGLDLDWALIRLSRPDQWRPNLFFKPGASSKAAFICGTAAMLPERDTNVLIILPSRTIKHGIIQPSTAFLGGINGDMPSRVWCVTLTDKQGLSPGDSGSIVVDAERFDIYGHVVGSNPLGEIYVSPLMGALKQIKGFFPESEVSLPHPAQPMAKLAVRYLKTYDYAKAQLQLYYLHQFIQSPAGSSFNICDGVSEELLEIHSKINMVFNQQHKATFHTLLGLLPALEVFTTQLRRTKSTALYYPEKTRKTLPRKETVVDKKVRPVPEKETMTEDTNLEHIRLKNALMDKFNAMRALDESAVIDEDDVVELAASGVGFSPIVSPSAPLSRHDSTTSIREHLIEAPRFQPGRTRRVS